MVEYSVAVDSVVEWTEALVAKSVNGYNANAIT